jgi:hypothetical protein
VSLSDDNLPETTKVACVECPWRRDSAPGWLGPSTPEEWVEMAHGETAVACHTTVKSNDQPWEEVKQCRGIAQFRQHIFKTPRNPRIETGPADRERIFSWDDEFLAHHVKAREALEQRTVRELRAAWELSHRLRPGGGFSRLRKAALIDLILKKNPTAVQIVREQPERITAWVRGY